jgi:hypothetical protein
MSSSGLVFAMIVNPCITSKNQFHALVFFALLDSEPLFVALL